MKSPRKIFLHCDTKVFDSLYAIEFPAKELHLIQDALERYPRSFFHCKVYFILHYPFHYRMQVVQKIPKSIYQGQ